MAFKMKGSAFKLGNVATKSALKDTKADYTEDLHHKGTVVHEDDDTHAGESPGKMKSPMMQIESGTCAVCGGTREQHNPGQWNYPGHAYRMGQAEKVQDFKDKRKIDMEAKKAELIEKYGSWEAAVAANEKKIAENTNKGSKMKSPLEHRYRTTQLQQSQGEPIHDASSHPHPGEGKSSVVDGAKTYEHVGGPTAGADYSDGTWISETEFVPGKRKDKMEGGSQMKSPMKVAGDFIKNELGEYVQVKSGTKTLPSLKSRNKEIFRNMRAEGKSDKEIQRYIMSLPGGQTLKTGSSTMPSLQRVQDIEADLSAAGVDKPFGEEGAGGQLKGKSGTISEQAGEDLARVYGDYIHPRSESKSEAAYSMDDQIQRKINKGEELNPQEKLFQERQLKFVNLSKPLESWEKTGQKWFGKNE